MPDRSSEDNEALNLARALCQMLTETLNRWSAAIFEDRPADLLVDDIRRELPHLTDAVDRACSSVSRAVGRDPDPDQADPFG